MNTKITALALIAVTALSLAPKPAEASDKTLAVLGGFIGGVLVASEINHNRDYYPTAPAIIVNDRCDDGYWRVVEVRVWVPGYWVTDCYRGRSLNRYVDGHYECRSNRVWVSYGRNDRHDRRDREIGYGYGHRR
jgi:hypothetical protein